MNIVDLVKIFVTVHDYILYGDYIGALREDCVLMERRIEQTIDNF